MNPMLSNLLKSIISSKPVSQQPTQGNASPGYWNSLLNDVKKAPSPVKMAQNFVDPWFQIGKGIINAPSFLAREAGFTNPPPPIQPAPSPQIGSGNDYMDSFAKALQDNLVQAMGNANKSLNATGQLYVK